MGLATIFYCLRFKTSLFVASYDSQGHSGYFLNPLNPSISCFPMQLLLAYSLPRNPTVKSSISLVTTYYIRVSDRAVVSIFISAETELN
jgi:hypothetical protein